MAAGVGRTLAAGFRTGLADSTGGAGMKSEATVFEVGAATWSSGSTDTVRVAAVSNDSLEDADVERGAAELPGDGLKLLKLESDVVSAGGGVGWADRLPSE